MESLNKSDFLEESVQKFGQDAVNIRLLKSGHNADIYLIDQKGGERLIAKVAKKDGNAQLALEGWMLRYLKSHTSLPVPDVQEVGSDILIMTYIPDCGRVDRDASKEAAEYLAALHNIHGKKFGFERDTVIGPLNQPNPWEGSWVKFFRDHRLLYMAGQALNKGAIDANLMAAIEKLAGKLDAYIDEPKHSSLIHGDVWAGNVLAVPGKVTAFIDPALYYADPEIELAFTTLFNTFDKSFMQRYQEIRPLRPGFFDVRIDLYNLYPLLVHAIIYGDVYRESIERIVKHLV